MAYPQRSHMSGPLEIDGDVVVGGNTSFVGEIDLEGEVSNAGGAGNLEQFVDVQITSTQLLALNATAQTIVPAPGAGKALIFTGAVVHKPAGTAYAGIADGEDLSVKYTNGSGLEVAQIETTGFLDQTSVQTRYARPATTASGDSSITPVANAALVLHLLVGEVTTGNSPLNLRVFFRVVPTVIAP